MKTAILSDIHANLEALESALQFAHSHNIDKIYCLGDVVGYGPNPNECVDLVRTHCDAVLMGNHDYAAIGIGDIQHFNEYAKISAHWTRTKITENNLEYIKTWAFSHDTETAFLVHASPKNPSGWDYVLSVREAKEQLKTYSQDLCFIGHSHVPVIYSTTDFYRQTTFDLKEKQKYLINVGSVGQPRDGDPRSCFVIFDDETNKIQYIRLDYEIQKTYNKIVTAGLPVFLAERLLKGY